MAGPTCLQTGLEFVLATEVLVVHLRPNSEVLIAVNFLNRFDDRLRRLPTASTKRLTGLPKSARAALHLRLP